MLTSFGIMLTCWHWPVGLDPNPTMCTRVGKGHMLWKLFSALTLVNFGGREIDQSALVRYLSEAVYFPTALLPSRTLRWEPLNDDSARATLVHGGLCVSAVFYFNARGQIIRLTTADRPRWGHAWQQYSRHTDLPSMKKGIAQHLVHGLLPQVCMAERCAWKPIFTVEHGHLGCQTRRAALTICVLVFITVVLVNLMAVQAHPTAVSHLQRGCSIASIMAMKPVISICSSSLQAIG